MQLLTPEVLDRFAAIGSQTEDPDPIVVAKFFNPAGAGTWYATEYDPQTRCFYGYVSLFGDECDEWGVFSLDELASLRVPLQVVLDGQRQTVGKLGLERDLHFQEQRMSEVEPRAVWQGARPVWT